MNFKIGDRIFVRGYIDEIRKDTVIVRNDGGYFGTILSEVMGELPSAQPEPCEDTVSRQRLLNDLKELVAAWKKYPVMAEQIKGVEAAIGYVEAIPSAQPEHTCVNCGRTANNGGWYADGRTRCPIEEHYALPKDGFCHLWEKRNVTDDDYPERRTDE